MEPIDAALADLRALIITHAAKHQYAAIMASAMPDSERHEKILREMATALAPIRSDWATAAEAVADHLLSLSVPY